LLVNRQLLGNFGSGLSGQEVFQLDVKLFFFLDDDIFLDDLFGFLDKALLKGLNLLEQLPSVWVGTLEFPPSMVVEGVLKFFRESLHLETLIEELLVE
jgi:hypothetical protein